jgi:uncharacterized membrane protein YqjE
VNWEQIVILVLLLVGLSQNLLWIFKDKNQTSGTIATLVVFLLALEAFYVWTLHCGGFW